MTVTITGGGGRGTTYLLPFCSPYQWTSYEKLQCFHAYRCCCLKRRRKGRVCTAVPTYVGSLAAAKKVPVT
eukprot:1159655-Pelagomonas_calceolata.AAC.2